MLTNALFFIIPALISLTIHELAHGYTAYRLGDPTAKNLGRLTLNPLKHIDIIGLVMILLVRFGWAKPVPVDMRNFKKPKQYMAITALAGPVSNFILAVVMLFIYGLLYTALGGYHATGGQYVTLTIIQYTATISIFLGFFNLMPIPPLDGSKVIFSLLPNNAYNILMRYERYGFILLLIVVWTGFFWRMFGAPISAVISWLNRVVVMAAFNLVN